MLDHSTNEHVGWTDERIEILTTMWTNGDSAGVIASVLGGGVTRNGVIGKVNRLKLKSHGANPSKAKLKKVKPTQVAPRHGNAGQPKAAAIIHNLTTRKLPPMEIVDEVPEGVDVTALIGIMRLNDSTCRFPVVGSGAGALFCGQHTQSGSKYCSSHHKRVYYSI